MIPLYNAKRELNRLKGVIAEFEREMIRERTKHGIDNARPARAAVALVAIAAGAMALGALAIGALAIGRMVIGRLAVAKVRLRNVEIDELTVRRLRVLETDPNDKPAAAEKES